MTSDTSAPDVGIVDQGLTDLVHAPDNAHGEAASKVIGEEVGTLAFGAGGHLGSTGSGTGGWGSLGGTGREGTGENAVNDTVGLESGLRDHA